MVEPPAREGLERAAAILPLDSEEEGRETRIPAVGSSFTDNVDPLAETGLGPDPLQVEDGVRGRGMDELVKALFTTAGADPEETAADAEVEEGDDEELGVEEELPGALETGLDAPDESA